MKLTQILLELDTRDVKYPGIKPKELIRDYKERMKKIADKKTAKKEYDKSKYVTVAALKRGAEANKHIDHAMNAVSVRNNYIRTEDQNDNDITDTYELLAMTDEMKIKLNTKLRSAPNRKVIKVSKVQHNGISYWNIFDKKYYKELEDMFMDAVDEKLFEEEEVFLFNIITE